jgi:hypothetical protein
VKKITEELCGNSFSASSHRYLNMDDLHEHKKEALRRAA